MSDGMNKVMLLGNLGADPELRHTAAGRAVLNIRMATTETWLDKDKTPQSNTEWHSVVVWGNRATGLAKVLKKGNRILVEGGLRTSNYEKDGVKRYKTEVHATQVCFADGGGNKVSRGERNDDGGGPVVENNYPPVQDDDIPY